MKNLKLRAAVLAAGLLLIAGIGYAQRGGTDWQTGGYDAQRSGWVRADSKVSVESMSKPGYQLVWKVKSTNTARQGNNLTPPAMLEFFIGHRGFRSLAFVGGSGDYAMGIDVDLGKIEWERKFAQGPVAAGTSPACPGGMTTALTRPASIGYPAAFGGRGFGRSSAPKSTVGAPGEGSAILKELASRGQQQPFGPPPTAGAKPNRTAPAANPFQRMTQWVHGITSDGKFRSVYVSNGDEPNPGIDFLPANAHARGLLVSDRVAYVATVNNCGGVADGIWRLDIEGKKVTNWKAPAAIAGTGGFAVSPEGVLFVAAGKDLVALDMKTLGVKGSVALSANLTSSPVVFENKDRDLVAVTTADGKLHVIDGEKLGAPLASIDSGAAAYAVGALASWQDATNARWLLVPTADSVQTFQFDGSSLKAGWKSRALNAALTPAVVNGVVFALSSGGKASKAVVYALDGMSGKELWNSGAAITSNVTSGGFSFSAGRVYVSGVDGTQYAFGFHMEI